MKGRKHLGKTNIDGSKMLNGVLKSGIRTYGLGWGEEGHSLVLSYSED